MNLRLEALAVALAGAALLVGAGPRGALRQVAALFRAFARPPGPAVAGAAVGLLLALLAADPGFGVGRTLTSAALGTACVSALWMLAFHRERAAERLLAGLLGVPDGALAALAGLAAVIAGRFVLGDIPHVSDEVAYQFQARALAQGRLGFPPPADPEFFEFVHTTLDGGLWHGIMNPGWPLLLAPGIALGVGWLVNPLMAAATVPLLASYLRRTGVAPEAVRLALWLLVASPFFVFMSGTYMSHAANLALFAAFLACFARLREGGGLRFALGAGAALSLGVLVRPLDTLVATAPFGVLLLVDAWRAPRSRLATLIWVGALGATGALLTLGYNAALTGHPLEFPQTRYFAERFPGQEFGLGFGPQMGTVLHGPEWPGYEPTDAPRVTAERLLQFLGDLHGLPLGLAAAIALGVVAAVRRRLAAGTAWLCASALALVAVYLAHFYHGIAYGSRHYYLALPAGVLLLASPLARWREAGGASRRAATAAALALLAHTLVFAWPERVAEYGDAYRSASATLRHAVRNAGLHQALVFVAPDRWGWKSGFPLNEHPLERNDVLFARDLGPENARLAAHFPGRRLLRARILPDDRVVLEPLPEPGPQRPPPPGGTGAPAPQESPPPADAATR